MRCSLVLCQHDMELQNQFMMRQLQEKYLTRKKNLCFAFVYFEKAFDWVPRDVAWWTLRKLVVEEWLVRNLQSIYENVGSRVRVNETFNKDSPVQLRLHQGSVLSPLLFVIVLEALSRVIRSVCLEELLYAGDFAVVTETLEGLNGRPEVWKGALEPKWLRVNVKKAKMMISDENAGKVATESKFACAVCRKSVGSR